MSKDFKEEYTEMLASDVPDLWNRIEASLPEKEKIPIENSQEIQKKTKKILNKKEAAKKKMKRPLNTWIKIGSGIAAVFCILITGGVFLNSQMHMQSATTATEMMMEESIMEQDMAENVIDANPSSNTDSAFETGKALDTTADVASGSVQEEEQKQEIPTFKIQIEVISSKSQADKKIYSVAVINPFDTAFEANSQIVLFTSENSELTMEDGAQYTVTVSEEQEDGFELLAIQ